MEAKSLSHSRSPKGFKFVLRRSLAASDAMECRRGLVSLWIMEPSVPICIAAPLAWTACQSHVVGVVRLQWQLVVGFAAWCFFLCVGSVGLPRWHFLRALGLRARSSP